MLLKSVFLVYAFGIGAPLFACGWWGDAEQTADVNAIERSASFDESAESMVRIGDRFRTGSGGLKDDAMALSWYQKAAALGHSGAQYNLGRMYEHGIGVAVDNQRAAQSYLLAATQGDMHAQHHLGEMYRTGRGVARDEHEAWRWTLRSAEQGHVEVFTDLASHYWHGRGVARDPVLAYMWWWLAALNGNENTQSAQAPIGIGLETEQINKAKELAQRKQATWR